MVKKILKNYIETRPNDIFIHYNSQDITYENIIYSLENRIKSIQAINIKKNSVIGIYVDNSLDLIEVLFACIEVQAIPLIIPSGFKPSEIDNISNQVEFDYFITNWSKSKYIQNSNTPIVPIEELSPSIGGCAPSKIIKYDLNQVACLLLTSGTSGVPKIAQISIENMIASCNAWNKIMNFDKKDIYFNCLPLHHIGGISIIFRALLFGFKVILSDKFNQDLSIQQMVQHKATITSLVPTMLYRIINSKTDLSKILRAVIIGGSDCSENLIKNAIDKKMNIYKSYGMTESSSGVSGFWVKDNIDNINSAGVPHSQIEIKIIENEILIKGPSIIKQYYKGPLIKDWYYTNDRGYIDKNGFLYVIDRKNFAISGGENIDLKEIENTIKKHPKINKAFVKNISDDEWGVRLIAYISCKELESFDIKDWLKSQLSDYKVPKEFIRID